MIQELQQTLEAPHVQDIDEIVDVPVVLQRQVLISQTVQRMVEVPQVQFFDRLVDVPVAMQRQVPCPLMPRERIQEHIDEEIIEVTGSRVMEKIIEGVKPIPQERVQSNTVEEIVSVPVPRIPGVTGEVIQLIRQDRISDHIVGQFVDISSLQIQEQTVGVGEVQQHTEKQIARVHANDQPDVQIQVFKDERAATKHNIPFRKFHLHGVLPAPCGALEIDATFGIDANEVLNASAQDKSTGNPSQISITNERTLPAEIDRMAQDAEKDPDEDEVNTAAAQETASTQQPHRSQQQQDRAGQEERRGKVEKGKAEKAKEEEEKGWREEEERRGSEGERVGGGGG